MTDDDDSELIATGDIYALYSLKEKPRVDLFPCCTLYMRFIVVHTFSKSSEQTSNWAAFNLTDKLSILYKFSSLFTLPPTAQASREVKHEKFPLLEC